MFKGMVKDKTEDNKFSAAQEHKIISAFEMVENIVEKGAKCLLSAYSPFPTMFSKALFHGN